MLYCLENEFIAVKIKETGAELCSYYDKNKQREIIWQADPLHWKRHAPILFPIVGKVNNNIYKLEKETFTLSQHGFARDQEFRVVEQSDSSITLINIASKTTKEFFPFDYALKVMFSIFDKELKVTYKVENPSLGKMFFCIGAHPGFNCPFDKASNFSDYELEFEKTECSDRILLNDNGFRTGKRAKEWLSGNTIKLSEDLFNQDALIFDDLKSTYLTIGSKKKNIKERVKIGWFNYPHMGIWKPLKKAPFLCIEPWNGMADEANSEDDFKNKYGVIHLESGNYFECFYTIENISK